MVVNRVRTGLLVSTVVVLAPAAVLWAPMDGGYQSGFGHWLGVVVGLIAVCVMVSVAVALRPTSRSFALGLAGGAVVVAPLVLILICVYWLLFVFTPA